MCDFKNCQQDSGSDSSGFIFGILIGAIIGAVIAVLIYKNNKSEVFADLKENLEKYFSKFTGDTSEVKTKSPKVAVVLPHPVSSVETVPVRSMNRPRKFIKPKK